MTGTFLFNKTFKKPMIDILNNLIDLECNLCDSVAMDHIDYNFCPFCSKAI
jgi:hypothetical protein